MKRTIAVFTALILVMLAGCGIAEHGPVVPGTLTVDDEEIAGFAQIASDALETPELLAMHEEFLNRGGDESPVPAVDRAVEVILPESEKYNTCALHFYVINIQCLYFNVDEDTMFDAVIVVYDCDTGRTYLSSDSAFLASLENAAEGTKDHFIRCALTSGYMLEGLPEGDWVFYCENESHAALDGQQLQTLNSQLHPEGWEYRAEVVTLPDEDGQSAEEIPEQTETPENEDAELPEESSGEMSVETLSDEELCRIAADAVNSGLAEGKFGSGELIDHTLTAAKEYRITIDGEEPYEMHLLYLWLNGNRENGNDYAGQILIDLSSGETMYLCDYDEAAIGFDTPGELMYYYYWQGLTAVEGSGFLMNETESLTDLPDTLIREIQSQIAA